MIKSPKLIVEVPQGGAVQRQLTAAELPSITGGEVVVAAGPTDADGRLEAAAAGQIVLSVPSPAGLSRDPDSVRRVIGEAGTGTEPLVIVVEAAEELLEEELSPVLAAAGHTSRAVILRVIADG
jgi:hypothetical protein